MSIQITTEVHGLAELEKMLKSLPQELVGNGRGARNPVYQSLDKAADAMLEAARSGAPVRTGRLRDAIKKQRHPRPKKLNEIVGVGVDPGRKRDDPKGAWYGYIVEKKTNWMRRAAETTRETSIRIFAEELKKRLDRIAKKLERQSRAKK